MTTRPPDDDPEMRELLAGAARSWRGPSPLASGSRWAESAARDPAPRRRLRLASVAVLCGLALIGLGAAAAGTSWRDGRTAVADLVAHVLEGAPPPSPGQPAPSPVRIDGASPAAGPPAPAASSLTVPAATPRAKPSATPRPWSEDDSRPTPQPSGSARPSPSPSRTPDD